MMMIMVSEDHVSLCSLEENKHPFPKEERLNDLLKALDLN